MNSSTRCTICRRVMPARASSLEDVRYVIAPALMHATLWRCAGRGNCEQLEAEPAKLTALAGTDYRRVEDPAGSRPATYGSVGDSWRPGDTNRRPSIAARI